MVIRINSTLLIALLAVCLATLLFLYATASGVLHPIDAAAQVVSPSAGTSGLTSISVTAVRAERIELTDGAGRVRAVLGNEDGVAGLTLLDKNGDSRIRVGISEDDIPVLSLRDATGGNTAGISLKSDGTPVLGVSSNESGAVVIGSSLSGSGISVVDHAGNARAVVQIGMDESARVALLDASGNTVWSVPEYP